MISASNPIGVFDSGLGGLTVVRELCRKLPHENIIYFGDTARLPYGNKSRETVTRFSTQNVLFLLQKKVKMVVVACNTASSLSLATLKRYFAIPVIGVIEPGVQEAVSVTRKGRVGVIGTKSTIKSGVYQKALKKLSPSLKVYAQGCPLFVPLVEEGYIKDNITRQAAIRYLMPLKKQGIDTLILGCTHYPLLSGVIRQVLGPDVKLVDSAKAVARQIKIILEEQGIASSGKTRVQPHRFYVSDKPGEFQGLAQRFLGRKIKLVKMVIDNV